MIEHHLKFICDECEKQAGVVLFYEVMTRDLPTGWCFVRGRLICDEHQVIVKDEEDG